MLQYFVDLMVISALVAVIIAGYKLNKQLKNFYKTYQPVETLNAQLMASLAKTEQSLENIKHFSAHTTQHLQEQINQALVLKEELSFLISRADQLANQLVERIAICTPIHSSVLPHKEPLNSFPSSLKNMLRNIR